MPIEAINTLNDLIETSKDGEFGFRSSAEYAKGAELKQMFTLRAQECQQAAVELQRLVTSLGGVAEDSGTFAGAAHRGWVAVKGSLSGYSDLALLEEAERGEDVALECYTSALSTAMPPEVKLVVQRQYEGVTRNHAQLRTLRDQARAANR